MPSAKVRIFCPNIRTLPNESARDRAMRLVRDIDAAADANVEIFLAPEYYFTHNTKDLPDPHKCIAYTAGEADTVRAIIARQSGEVTPHMLIVAGSMFMVQGVYDPHIFNTSFVYLDGGKVAECSKFDRAADATYAHECGRAFFPGETGTQFTFNGITCYLQICTDTTNAPPSTLNLSIVPAYIPGAAALANRASFDYRILSDGAGRYAFIDHGAGKGGPGPFYDCEVAV